MATPCPGGYGLLPHLVDAPPLELYRYGAMSAFNVIPAGDNHEANGIVYKSPACIGAVTTWEDNCDTSQLEIKAPTDSEQNSEVQGCPIHLLTVTSCKTTTLDAMFAEALEIYRLGEQRAIEAAVWENVIAQPTAVVINATPDAAGAVSLTQGLAFLESAIAECYGGQATIHADRGVSAYLTGDQAQKSGDHLETLVGSKWAFYAGAPNTGPDGVAAPDGHTWLYATSNVTLRTFPTEVRPDGVGHILLPNSNEPRVYVERTIVPSIECCAFAVLVCLDCD